MTKDGKLTMPETLNLQSMTQMPGYEVFLAVAERELENLRIDLQNQDPSQVEAEKIVAKQMIVYAAQKFWGQVEQSVREAVMFAEGLKPQPEPSPEQEAEMEQTRLLDATRR